MLHRDPCRGIRSIRPVAGDIRNSRQGRTSQEHSGAVNGVGSMRIPIDASGSVAGRFTDAIGHPPEACDTLRRDCVEDVVTLGKIASQAVRDLVLNLHRGHGSRSGFMKFSEQLWGTGNPRPTAQGAVGALGGAARGVRGDGARRPRSKCRTRPARWWSRSTG